jgi:hypothetical protein
MKQENKTQQVKTQTEETRAARRLRRRLRQARGGCNRYESRVT